MELMLELIIFSSIHPNLVMGALWLIIRRKSLFSFSRCVGLHLCLIPQPFYPLSTKRCSLRGKRRT